MADSAEGFGLNMASLHRLEEALDQTMTSVAEMVEAHPITRVLQGATSSMGGRRGYRTGIRPTSRRVLQELKDKKLTKEDVEAGRNNCVICLGNMMEGEMVLPLRCGHLFHRECVLPWLQRHDTCPVCRRDMNGRAQPARTANEETAGEPEELQQESDQIIAARALSRLARLAVRARTTPMEERTSNPFSAEDYTQPDMPFSTQTRHASSTPSNQRSNVSTHPNAPTMEAAAQQRQTRVVEATRTIRTREIELD
eukprot:m.87203 g.87203  ORF g.87203 m.87203 type:complete len:254 (+) comp13095_c0_seq2:336-1097(+)